MLIQRALKNGGFSIAAQLVNLALGVLFAGMTIRYLGPAQAGFFLIATSILGWTQIAGAGSFKAPAVQKMALYFAQNSFEKSRIVSSTVISANLIIAIPFILATIFSFPVIFSWSKLDPVLENSAFLVVIFGSIGFFSDQWSSSLRGVYEALQRFDIATYTSIIFSLLGNILRLIILISIPTMSALAIANLLISLIWLLADIYFTRRLLRGGYLPGWNWKALKPLLNFGFWSWIGNTSNVIYFNITGLILTKYLGSAYLPYIALPQNIIGKVHQFFISTSYFLFPTLAAQGESVTRDISRIDDRLRWFVAIGSIYIYTAIYLMGPYLLTILVDQPFAEKATIALGFYCLYGIFTAQMIVNVFTTMAIGKAQANSVVDIIISIVTIALTFVFIPIWGYIGVCAAQMAKLPGVVWHLFWSRKLLKLPLGLSASLSPYLTSTIAAVAWFFLSKFAINQNEPNLIQYSFTFVLGSVVYFGIVYLLENRFLSNYSRINSLLLVIKQLKVVLINSIFVQKYIIPNSKQTK